MKKQSYLLLIAMVFLIFYSTPMIAQDSSQTEPGFPFGVFSHIGSEAEKDSIEQAGFNYVVDAINDTTIDIPFKLMGHKRSALGEHIFYYTKGYYTRWEAERDTFYFLETGFKHPHPRPPGTGPYLFGRKDTLTINNNNYICWATDSTSDNKIDSVLWGPNYRQDKDYTAGFGTGRIEYTADYRMALSYDTTQYLDADTVCVLKIVYRYKWYVDENNWDFKTDTLSLSYLTVLQFPADSFKTFSIIYEYPTNFGNRYLGKFPEEMYSGTDTTFIDDITETGIEFQLDWYGVGKLYIDYVDLYDNIVGEDFVSEESMDSVVNKIKTYANLYSTWDHLEYWYVNDEPNTMDSYEPMRIVDSIITNYASFKRPTITEIYPHWSGVMNGDPHLQKFVELTKPKQLMIDRYPFVVDYSTEWGLTNLRTSFQDADNAQAGFWYVAQGFGEKTSYSSQDYCGWRKPAPEELNASIMLALAHGSKGIMIWPFKSGYSSVTVKECGDIIVYFDAMMEIDLTPTDLYYYVKDELSPRLNGTLGATLQKLTYERKYINFNDSEGEEGMLHTVDYLSIVQSGQEQFYHAGLMLDSNNTDNKYFLLTNLLTDTTDTRVCKIYINY